MILNYYRRLKQEIPENVWLFLKKALILFVVWKLLYHLVLYPIRQPDKWLSTTTTDASGYFLSLINAHVSMEVIEQRSIDPYNNREIIKTELWLNKKKAVRVGDGCNALELYVIYMCFLIAFWKNWKDFILFSIIGVISIFIINTLRIAGLGWVSLYAKKWFEFLHGYAFKIIVYTQIILLWILYAKKGEKS
ncbi:MAG: archaeosortase/exosortase family protein [Bacteroidetes bacterium]|nr:archaeosortase/exosortase family protein [Bacteroidota bacterium]